LGIFKKDLLLKVPITFQEASLVFIGESHPNSTFYDTSSFLNPKEKFIPGSLGFKL
jgi:hypothetical protein